MQFFARAVALDPGAGRYRRRLGAALLEAGELEIALDHLEQATELEPARTAGWVLLSSVLLRMRQPQRALEVAQRATQLSHSDADAWHQIAASAEALGQVETALDAYERSLARVSRFRAALDARAHLLERVGRWQRLAEVLREEADTATDPAVANWRSMRWRMAWRRLRSDAARSNSWAAAAVRISVSSSFSRPR